MTLICVVLHITIRIYLKVTHNRRSRWPKISLLIKPWNIRSYLCTWHTVNPLFNTNVRWYWITSEYLVLRQITLITHYMCEYVNISGISTVAWRWPKSKSLKFPTSSLVHRIKSISSTNIEYLVYNILCQNSPLSHICQSKSLNIRLSQHQADNVPHLQVQKSTLAEHSSFLTIALIGSMPLFLHRNRIFSRV